MPVWTDSCSMASSTPLVGSWTLTCLGQGWGSSSDDRRPRPTGWMDDVPALCWRPIVAGWRRTAYRAGYRSPPVPPGCRSVCCSLTRAGERDLQSQLICFRAEQSEDE